jgi:hypothetical protein
MPPELVIPPESAPMQIYPPPASAEPSGRAAFPRQDRDFHLSLEGGYALILGSDSDYLNGGGGFGLSLGYEFYRNKGFFLAGKFSFFRSMHSGKGALTGVYQNVNPLMIGLQGGYRTGRHEVSLDLMTGVVILDAGSLPGGRNDTTWGLQYGVGYAYWITSFLSVGPELRFTNGIDAGRYSTWFDLLGKVTFHF